METPTESEQLVMDRVRESLERIQPYLKSDGTSCDVRYIKNDVAYVSVVSNSVTNSGIMMTIRMGIERRIVEDVPEIRSIELVDSGDSIDDIKKCNNGSE